MPRSRIAALALAAAVAAGLAGCSAGEPESSASSSAPRHVPAPTITAPVDPAIRDLMNGAGMTPEGERVFVAASPTLEDKATLAQSCASLDTSASGTAHTYGCVVRGKIHVRLFSAPELHDMIYVVAAHELLHVVYGQLTSGERIRLDEQLQSARAGDAVLEERLKVYAASADDTPNEVHSVLGTEFAAISPDLAAHYSRYIDRTRVLGAFDRTLGDREAEIRRLEASVDEMKARLDNLSVEMEALRSAGDLRTFNARVPTFNALVREHNAAVDELKAKVAQHKALVSS